MAAIDIREGGAIPEKQVKQLFAALGWSHYDALLPELLLNSTFVVSAWDEARLVGRTLEHRAVRQHHRHPRQRDRNLYAAGAGGSAAQRD